MPDVTVNADGDEFGVAGEFGVAHKFHVAEILAHAMKKYGVRGNQCGTERCQWD